MDRAVVRGELERARATFHDLLDGATDVDLHEPSAGTRWTNGQLLFHMLFGYLIVRALLVLVRGFARLPAGISRRFAGLLDSLTGPFDVVNYYGSRVGARLVGRRRMGAMVDRVIASLHRQLSAESDAALARGMHFPRRWDPFFMDFMTLADVYRYPTQHFDFHRHQLTLPTHLTATSSTGARRECGDPSFWSVGARRWWQRPQPRRGALCCACRAYRLETAARER